MSLDIEAITLYASSSKDKLTGTKGILIPREPPQGSEEQDEIEEHPKGVALKCAADPLGAVILPPPGQ